MIFWRKIDVFGVLSRISLPTGLCVLYANFLGKKCARANFYTFRMSDHEDRHGHDNIQKW